MREFEQNMASTLGTSRNWQKADAHSTTIEASGSSAGADQKGFRRRAEKMA